MQEVTMRKIFTSNPISPVGSYYFLILITPNQEQHIQNLFYLNIDTKLVYKSTIPHHIRGDLKCENWPRELLCEKKPSSIDQNLLVFLRYGGVKFSKNRKIEKNVYGVKHYSRTTSRTVETRIPFISHSCRQNQRILLRMQKIVQKIKDKNSFKFKRM